MHILVADDNEILLTMIGNFLRRNNYHVATAKNGREALTHLEYNPRIDFIISDIHMPKITGTELLHIVQSNFPHIPLVLMSGATAPFHKQELLQLGAFGVLDKPFELNDLVKYLDQGRQIVKSACNGSIP